MEDIKIIIIDDSNMVHVLLEKIIADNSHIKIVGNAYDGMEGIDMVKKFAPHVVVMDIGMPKMDGLEAIQEIMHDNPVPIIVFSAASKNIVDLGFKAIEMGAVELIEKPYSADLTALKKNIEEKLIKSIINFADFKVVRRIKKSKIIPAAANETSGSPVQSPILEEKVTTPYQTVAKFDQKELPDVNKDFPVIGIASSTGGPQTLRNLISNLSSYYMNTAIVIVQHIADGFMNGFCEWLNNYSPIPVVIPQNKDTIKPSHIYVAPGEHHLVFDESGRFRFDNSPPIHGIRPSANMMLSSIGEVFRERSIGLILTGMGSDGTKGAIKIREHGGYVIAQDKESCFIYGMPKSAIEAGAVDRVLGITQIPSILEKICKERFIIKK